MYDRILVAVDDTEAGKRAFSAALPVAKGAKGKLFLVSVIEDLAQMAGETISQVDDAHDHAHKHFDWVHASMLERAQHEGVEASGHVLVGRMMERVLEFAQEHSIDLIDLIVLGGFGRSRLLGLSASRGHELGERASCAVLVAK